ncbi:MAG TPA: hypothetical protein VFE17_12530, partial [Candidatus Baltobacteraceae bacterium]|nr:hypothetical protein [Candidatus Baltobacteraceae bacterium]
MLQPAKTTRTLERAIDELLDLASTTATTELCGWLASLWLGAGQNLRENSFGLSSPLRQTLYLIGLAMSTLEPESPAELGRDRLDRMVTLLNEIVEFYARRHSDGLVAGKVEPKKVHIAGQGFLHYFMAGRIAVAEQIAERVRELCVPYDDVLAEHFNITARDTLDIAHWLGDELQRRLDDAAAAVKVQLNVMQRLGVSPEVEPDPAILERFKSDEFSEERKVVEKGIAYMAKPNGIPV